MRTEKDTYASLFTLNFNTQWGRLVPEHTREPLRMYLNHRIEPGGFLSAVLSNNLYQAACRADAFNSQELIAIIRFIESQFPVEAWGSMQAISDWCYKD